MFQSIFKRAEDAIENTVGQILIRVLVVIPFLIALAFGVAAVYGWLSREYGSEAASLIIAGIFAAVGAGMAVYASARTHQQTTSGSTSGATSSADTSSETGSNGGSKPYSDVDKDLIYAALTSAAPIALPIVARLVLRNLPLITAIGAALFIMTRSGGDQSRSSTSQQ